MVQISTVLLQTVTNQDTLNLIKSTVAPSNVIYHGCVPLN